MKNEKSNEMENKGSFNDELKLDEKYSILKDPKTSLEDFKKALIEFTKKKDNEMFKGGIFCDNFIFPKGFILDEIPYRCLVFNECIFQGEVEFNDLNFKFGPYFNNCIFQGKAIFHNFNTGGDCHFQKTIFKDKVIFKFSHLNFFEIRECQFHKDILFLRCIMLKTFELNNIISKGNLEISRSNSNGIIYFENIKISSGNNLILNKLNLENCQEFLMKKINIGQTIYLDTNLEKIDFEACEWPRYKGRYLININDRKNSKELSDYDLEMAIRNYRMLKNSFQDKSILDYASDMYIGEMELLREKYSRKWKNPILKILHKELFSLLAIYKLISFYGERYYRPLIIYLIILLLFPTFYLLTGFSYDVEQSQTEFAPYKITINYDLDLNNPFFMFQRNFWSDWLMALRISFLSSTLQIQSDKNLKGIGNELFTIQRIFSAALVALFLLAIRRKFKRY